MKRPIWQLKDKAGNEVWSSHERDYLTMIDMLVRDLGYELVRMDIQPCERCGQCNGACICETD